jgi:hypothetical protein
MVLLKLKEKRNIMLVYKLIKIEDNRPNVEVELSDEQLDAIFAAMSDYQDYGDEEQEVALSVQDALSELFSG